MIIHDTTILWIFTDGTELPLMLVLKGISWGRVEKEYKKHSLVKDQKMFANYKWKLKKSVHNESLNFRSLEKILWFWNSKGYFIYNGWCLYT